MKRLHLLGQRFSHWTIFNLSKKSKTRFAWLCLCDCGTIRLQRTQDLVSGKSKSCGCSQNVKHGESSSTEYRSWKAMIYRCSVPSSINYKNYGGRGIKVCERWMDFGNFISDVGRRPSKRHSISRINNDGNYEPKNVCWSTWEEQNNNKRSNHVITFSGITASISTIARLCGMRPDLIFDRLKYGWTFHRAFTEPPIRRRNAIS